MKRRILLCAVVFAVSGLFVNTSYGAFGTETHTSTIIKIACSSGGSGSLSGELSPGGGGAGISGSGVTVYAHYAGTLKSCPGWSWGCFDAGAIPVITNTTPVVGCPNRT